MSARGLFEGAAAASRALEAAKSDPSRLAAVSPALEGELDRAWDALGRVAEGRSDSDARLIALRYLDGMTWAEVSAACGICPKTAQRRVWRAFRWLDEQVCGDENPRA